MDAMPRIWRRKLLSSIFLFLGLNFFFCRLSHATLEQGIALQEVKNSGWITQNLTSWTPGTDPCVSHWVGIDCDTMGNIITLNLTHTGLRGPIPLALGRLTLLKYLDLGNDKTCEGCGPWNRVTGDLTALGTLVNLERLILTSNELSLSTFPTAIFQLTKLTDLRLDNTLIEGGIPLQISTLHNLQYLYLGNNSFGGTIPGSALSSLTNLKELSLWGNSLNGVLPPELGNLVNLTYLNANKNNLYGGLPPEYGKLTLLKKLLLYKNTFTGPIPDTWRGMTSMQDLEINVNYLYGGLPSWLLKMPAIKILQLGNNQLSGQTLPVLNISTAPSLKYLYADCNYLEGVRPKIDNITAALDYNCWENEGSLDSACVRALNCLNFQLAVSNGKCPVCPSGQHMVNTTTCICFRDPENSSKKLAIAAIVGGVVGGVFLLLLVVAFFIFRARKKSRKSQPAVSHPDYFQIENGGSTRSLSQSWEAPGGVHHFSIKEIIKATNRFDKANEIGEGGFGKVFVGKFPCGRSLAIKQACIADYSSETGRGQFRNEVSLLSRLHHKNLVRLEGFCDDGGQQILVYEYMKLGNLHDLLHGNVQGKHVTLDWYKRLEIAVNVAQGLDYLHSFAHPPVIHRDVKPSNILLDDNLVAKVADFGISKETIEMGTHVSTRPVGTAGYWDPQYFLRLQLTAASDVYSYGIVLLELITGRKAIESDGLEEDTNIVEWTRAKMEACQDALHSIVDPRLEGDYPKRIFKYLVDLALKCASFERQTRPTMKYVVSVLEPLLQEAERPPQRSSQSLSFSRPLSSSTTETKVGGTGSSKSTIRSDIEFSNLTGDTWDTFPTVASTRTEVPQRGQSPELEKPSSTI